MTTATARQLSQEFIAGPARVRIDVHGATPVGVALADKDFLDYRLADVKVSSRASRREADIVWERDAQKGIAYDGRCMTFRGDWPSGPMQKVVVAMLALRLEENGLHPFHASAVRYRDKTIMFLGGESNHGKSMGQIEACRRGALLVSTETTVIDEDGVVVDGSKRPFLKKRNVGTERADKAAPERGVQKFFGAMPTWELYTERSPVDVVIVPAIDGNFDPSSVEMIPFERQFQIVPLAPELLPAQRAPRPGPPDADDRHRRAPGCPGGLHRNGSPSVPTTSCAPQRRRCCWTRWSGSSSSTAECARSSTSGRTGLRMRSRCWQATTTALRGRSPAGPT